MNFTPKHYFLREEIPIADELLGLADDLRKEFLEYHQDFIDGDFVKGTPYQNVAYDTNTLQSERNAWKTDGIKYQWDQKKILDDKSSNPEILARYKTAAALTKKYADVCPVSSYSILEKNSVIKRHVGLENITGETIRIHIPLFVPEGDIFLETEGVEIDWSDIFGFANQYIHSAHNYSNTRRLVYLIDIKRKYLGLPRTEICNYYQRLRTWPPFVRGQFPKQYHTKQLV
jgi:hypothetical protein